MQALNNSYILSRVFFVILNLFLTICCEIRMSRSNDSWVKLNVGGIIYHTTTETLLKDEDSMLHRMFADNQLMEPGKRDLDGNILIDRNGRYFEPILNYLRTGLLIYDSNLNPEGILEEAKFFGISNLISQLQLIVDNLEPSNPDSAPLTRQDVVRALIQTSFKSELRFQGVNMSYCDLSKLDLRNINFKVIIIC